jgi:single-stranded DNA-specific DHH superfamily exonuclease
LTIIETKEKFLESLGTKDGIRIASHGDADGISSAFIAAYAFRKNKPEVYFPTEFSDVTKETGEVADLVLDKVPVNTYTGHVIDHHPDHAKDAKYNLFHGKVPASLLSLQVFKERIPKEVWWKAVPGIVGDGQPEQIPPEIIQMFPSLMEEVTTVRNYRGETKTYTNPVWFLLSSPINSACRIGKRSLAFSTLVAARDPYELIFSEALADCKELFQREVDRVRNASRAINIGPITIWLVDSNYSVNGTLAWELYNQNRKTAIVINEHTRHGSIRGLLVDYLKTYVDPKWKVGGHSGFAGISLPKIEADNDADRKAREKEQLVDFLNEIRRVVPR